MRTRLSTPARLTGDVLVALLFAVALSLPLGGRFLDPGADTSVLPELRNPAPAPRVPRSLARVPALPRQCEAWLADHFGFRRALVRGHNAVKVFGFGVSPTDRAVMSSDLWVFTTVNRTFESYRGTFQLSAAELERWRVVLEARRDWLATRDIKYVFCFAPAKGSLYPERLPPGFRRGPQTALEQLRAYLAEHSDFQLLDLHEPLRAAKAGDAEGDWLYYKLGSHWTDRGGFVAAETVLASLRPALPNLHVPSATDYERLPAPDQGDNWAGRLHLEDSLLQRRTYFQPRSGWGTASLDDQGAGLGTRVQDAPDAPDAERAPRLLLLHDSFGAGVWPALAESFSESQSLGSFQLDAEVVLETAPDVVVQVMAERRLAIHRPRAALGDSSAAARAAFERAPHRVARFEDAQSLRRLQSWSGAELSASVEDASLSVRCRGAGQGLLLPELSVPAGTTLVLRVELTAPHATTLAVLYQTLERPEYLPSRALHIPLVRGRNELFIEVPATDLAGPLLVLPGRRRGRYEVHSIEVRATD